MELLLMYYSLFITIVLILYSMNSAVSRGVDVKIIKPNDCLSLLQTRHNQWKVIY